MPVVMCAQKLWKIVKGWDAARTRADGPQGRLGRWAATRFQEQGDDVLVAISERAHLTVVIPPQEQATIQSAFIEAVGVALQDLHVPEASIALEIAAMGPVSLRYLDDPDLRDSLNYLKTFCALELTYHSDLRRVQRNLNDLPHPKLAGHVPAAAVAALFGRTAPDEARDC